MTELEQYCLADVEATANAFAELKKPRRLATVRLIDAVDPIPGADAIEVATVGGWKIVVKRGEYSVGDLAVYLEVDSWVPHDLAPFLTKPGHAPKEFEGVKGERLRTIRLRKQLSQGLLLPLSVLNVKVDGQEYETLADEGTDVTEILGILKYEKPLPACLRGTARGNFPVDIPKTDQDRIQNKKREFHQEFREHRWEVTEKLHGSSCTFYMDTEGVFHVCSRNLDLVRDENNAYWKVAIAYDVEQKMRDFSLLGYAIQGELVGEGINGNQYGIAGLDFFVFDIYKVGQGYLRGIVRFLVTEDLKLKHVPIISTWTELTENNMDYFLAYAEGKSKLNGSEREGLVWKSEDDPSVSFKVISNKWLLGGGEDQ